MLSGSLTAVFAKLFLFLSLWCVHVRSSQQLRGEAQTDGLVRYRNTQSKIVRISNKYFPTGDTNFKPLIRPTLPDAWMVFGKPHNHVLQLKLNPDWSWLPGDMTFQTISKWPLQLHGYEQDGTTVSFERPITMGYIIPDLDGVTCDDSCAQAFDGICMERRGLDDDSVEYPQCDRGTDCTDCGGVGSVDVEVTCSNTCRSAHDDVCDDSRGTGLCADGTDCGDCGTRPTVSGTPQRYGGAVELGWQSVELDSGAKLFLLSALLLSAALGLGFCLGARYKGRWITVQRPGDYTELPER